MRNSNGLHFKVIRTDGLFCRWGIQVGFSVRLKDIGFLIWTGLRVSFSKVNPKRLLLNGAECKYVCCCVHSWSSSWGRRRDERNLRHQGKHRYGLVTLIASWRRHTGSASQALPLALVRDGYTQEWRGRALDKIAFHRKGHGKRGSWRKRGERAERK